MEVTKTVSSTANEELSRRSVGTPSQAQAPALPASTVVPPAIPSPVSPSPDLQHTEPPTTMAIQPVQSSTASAVRITQPSVTSTVQLAQPSAALVVQLSANSAVRPIQPLTTPVIQPVQFATLAVQPAQPAIIPVVQPIQPSTAPATQPVQLFATMAVEPIQPFTATFVEPVQPYPTPVAHPHPDLVIDPAIDDLNNETGLTDPAVTAPSPDTTTPHPTPDHDHSVQNDLSTLIPAGPYPKFLMLEIRAHLSSAANTEEWQHLVQLYLEFEIASPSKNVCYFLILYITVSDYHVDCSPSTKGAAG